MDLLFTFAIVWVFAALPFVYNNTADNETMCDCSCEYMDKIDSFENYTSPYVNKTQEEVYELLKEKLEEVKQQIAVEKDKIPAVKAKKISANDDRPSSQNLGYLGIALLGITFGGIVVLDLLSLPQFIQNIRDGIKT